MPDQNQSEQKKRFSTKELKTASHQETKVALLIHSIPILWESQAEKRL